MLCLVRELSCERVVREWCLVRELWLVRELCIVRTGVL